MSTRELVRYRVLSLVLEGPLALQDAAEKLGLSPRHACRLLLPWDRSGGEGGIRTHGPLARSTVFETAPFDHSGTSPKHARLDHGSI